MSLIHFLAVSAVFAQLLSSRAMGSIVNPSENTDEDGGVNDVSASANGKQDGKVLNGKRKALPMSMSGQPDCSNYKILSSPDRAQGATVFQPSQHLCDSHLLTPGWYRFTGDAGNKMASQCVPQLRCGTHAPGWMNGNHPTANGSIVQREVCFKWRGDCCHWRTNIRVRNCGNFYIYELPNTPNCWLRYCGNALGPLNKTMQCGGNFTNLTGQITSPGYPTYMEPIRCNWTIKSAFDGNILLYFEDMTLSHEGCSSNILSVDTNGRQETFCRTEKSSFSILGRKIVNIEYHSSGWKMKIGFKLKYVMIHGNLETAEVQTKWNIGVEVKGSSIIQVSWQAFNRSVLKPNETVYGYVVVCKSANQRPVYVLTKPDATTINITELAGSTQFMVQVVALVAEQDNQNNKPVSIYGSMKLTTYTKKEECENYKNLTSWNRAQGSAGGGGCDRDNMVFPAWYRFGGQAGTQIATSCVPKTRCGTNAPGWMIGTHPSVQDGIVTRTVCFHRLDNCCLLDNTIRVRNCGGFYVYKLYRQPVCNTRYCGNKGGCGRSINNITGPLTSPGYPNRIYWNSKCQWDFTAPSPSGAIVVIVEHLSIPISARCLVYNLTFEDGNGLEVGKACGIRSQFSWMSRGSAILKFHSNRPTSRWVGFKARYFIFRHSLTDISENSQWTGVSAQAISSTAIKVQWGSYPASPIEYIIMCVPDGLPLNATVFIASASQNSLVVTGLMKYTNYTVQVVIRSSSGEFQYIGSQKTYETTAEDVPSQGPTHISAVAKENTMMVSWQPIPKHARNGIVTHYVIYYKKAWTSESWDEVKANKSAPLTVYLKGLKPATEYRIQIAGATAVGVGTMSKAVFAISGCNNVEYASGNHFTWTFNSPRYPNDNYLSNLNCTWWISSNKLDTYVVFDHFHLETADPCSDFVLIKQADGKNGVYCGKKDPFAVKLSTNSGFVRLKTDRGIEKSGFHARVLAVTNTLGFKYVDIRSGQNSATISFSPLEKFKGVILEYMVLYGKDDSSSAAVWSANINNTNKATLTGLDYRYEYKAFVLIRTTKGVYRASSKHDIRLTEPSATPEPEKPEITKPPTVKETLGMYPYGDSTGDIMMPNTSCYSTRCFRVDIPDDGMQFFMKRHHMVHICRNGLLLFETPQLIRWPNKFSEQRSLLRTAAMLAPYWALTDVEDSFVSLGISKVYYQVYKSTDKSQSSKKVLRQASYDVKKSFGSIKEASTGHFSATWVLKVTWVDLRLPDNSEFTSALRNTFQALVITNSTFSFAMYNYPPNGIQWSVPTKKEYYSLYAESYHGCPVVGLNSGEHNKDVPRHYDVIGSGTPAIVNINQLNGSTVYPSRKYSKPLDSKNHDSPGTWFFRLETMTGRINYKQKCIRWFKDQPDPRKYTEHLEPCPCTYRQAFLDERFNMDPEETHRICAYTVFESIDGWGQECCYDKSTGALLKGYPGGGTSRKNYMRSKRSMKENGYVWCCTYSSMCHLYYERRPSNNCSGYKETEWSWLWGDPHFVTLDGMNYTFNGLGEYIMADVSNGLFQLQARTKLAKGEGKATVFVSAVAKQTGMSAVQVNLKTGQGLEVLVNGSVIDHSTLTNSTTPFNGSVALSRPDDSSISVLFSCGISVKVTDVKDSLAILLAAPQRFKNKTRGLLGVWNDNPLDDLTTPTGHVLPTNATGRMIHYDFGQKWQVTESSSLFTYKKGENINTFSNSSFEPMFIEDFKFANETLKQEALEKCEGDVNCLFDAALTNDVAMGTSTKIVGSRLKNESEALKNSAPMLLNDSLVIYVTVNTTARIEIFAKDDDGDPLTFNVSGILPENLDINTDSSSSIVLVWTVTMAKIKFQVTVMDDKGDVALLRPKVHVCACHNGGYCSKDTNSNNVFADSSNDTFLIMPCTCIHGYTGTFCENDLDACQANLNPCYPGVKCIDLPPPADVFGYKCGPCPHGFSGDGATCLDLDECEGGNDGCSQICVNTPGSFVCDCNHGYRLGFDQKTCNDVDECYPSSDCMQKCKNTLGNYTCECDEGFKVDPYNPKKCVPKLPCTDGNHGCQHICYVKDRQQLCTCYQGYKLIDDRKGCKDIDECSTKKYRCNQYCHNTKGSYSCSCKKGFRMAMDGVTCNDVDECMELTYQCPDPSQICRNTAGSYKCVCGLGLYLTVNNTCREIPPGGMPLPTGAPPSPKPPSTNEKNNAVTITVKELKVSDWNEQLEMRFKQSVAKAVTSFCASKSEDCREKQKRERRALDYILYTADQVHLLPGFPKQINPKSRDLAAVIAFYVDFPPEIVSSSGDSIEGGILVEIVQSAKAAIEKALNGTISSVTLFNIEKPSTKKDPEKFHLYIIIGGSLAGVIFIVIVVVLIRRGMSHNEVLRIKRNQENEERRIRSRDASNECYDDGIHGEFRLGTVSTTDILGENNNQCIKTSQHGIDNLYVDTN